MGKNTKLWIVIGSLLFGGFTYADSVENVLLSKEEALDFCLNEWFPKLRMGHENPTPDQVRSKVSELLKVYTAGFEMIDPNNQDSFQTDIIKGEQVRAYYQAVLKTYPVWTFKILDIFPTQKGFILRYEGRDAPPVAKFEGVDIIDLEKIDGKWKIAKLIGYYDRVPFQKKEKP